MTGFLARFVADAPRSPAIVGSHAEISYHIEGSGPALLLLPLFHAPSQWTPAIPLLARHFTVVSVGGRHLSSIALLEDRARVPTYQAMFRNLIDTIAPQQGEAILDVGCGAGSLDRLLAQRLGHANPITARRGWPMRSAFCRAAPRPCHCLTPRLAQSFPSPCSRSAMPIARLPRW